MKITINEVDDTLFIKFSNNKFKECITITTDIIGEIDINNNIRAIEVLKYSQFKDWANDLLKENNLPLLQEDDIIFFMHQGYTMAYFNKQEIKDNDAPCKYYLEGESIVIDETVKQFLQREIDNIIFFINKNAALKLLDIC